MTFGQQWVLLLLAALPVWVWWEWSRSLRRAGIVLKALVFALIILALAEPQMAVSEQRMAVGMLADVSASVPAAQLERERGLAQQMESARGRNLFRVIAFDESTQAGEAPLAPDSGERLSAGRGTNIEAALRNAMAALPEERVPRLVLISDGRENIGSVERAIYQARLRGVPIDTIPLEGRTAPRLALLSLAVPAQAFSGERFPIEALVDSPSASAADVVLTAEGKSIGRSQVNLGEGQTLVRVWAQLDAVGATLVSGAVSAEGLGELQFQATMTLRRPKALLVSGDDESSHLEPVLAAAGFEVERARDRLPPEIGDFHLIIANNLDLEQWSERDKTAAGRFVREGGGFLLIAGEKNLYLEKTENAEPDDLTRMLPAELAPPRAPEGTAVVLVLDKSSSMEGKKMDLARQSAIGLVENLRDIDQVGVLVFDNSFQWTAPLRRNARPEETRRLISGIIADGGTQIAPALREAFRNIEPSKAVYKHILLLTDGISEEGDSIALAREAAKQKITISTVGLGQDVNRAYLERVAQTAEGKSHFLLDISGLAQLVLRDVMEHTGSSVMEKPVTPEVVERAEILDGVAISEAGPLLGWVKFIAKPEAETLLRLEEKDPLLVRWQYGLGRSVVFASDVKDRWAANWVGWSGFDRFWANVVRDLLPRSAPTRTEAYFDSSSGEMVVRYELAAVNEGRQPPDPLPDLYVLGPEGFRKAARLERTAARTYEARLPIEGRFGLFRARAASDLEVFPEVAFYRPNAELEEHGADEALLRKISEGTGGRFNPPPAEVFDAAGRSIQTTMNLWPGLLALAILLNLVELAARKGWLPWLGRWA
jgi:Mg-chelatase subunit ChlD